MAEVAVVAVEEVAVVEAEEPPRPSWDLVEDSGLHCGYVSCGLTALNLTCRCRSRDHS